MNYIETYSRYNQAMLVEAGRNELHIKFIFVILRGCLKRVSLSVFLRDTFSLRINQKRTIETASESIAENRTGKMNTQFECIPCIVNSYLRLVETGVIPEPRQEVILRQLLQYLSQVDYNQSPPVMGRTLHRMIRESLQDPDPYHQIKVKYNRMMLELYPSFKGIADNSEDPFDTVIRLAVAGNVIDFGAKYQFDVMDTINRVLEQKLAIDDSRDLRHDLNHSQTLLYIGDNCGEIVFDKLFLESINLPQKYFVVRDSPVINDITLEDAKATDMEQVATVISTGDDAPGAVWESTSEEFKDRFINADVVISKGQGNLEGLIDIPHEHIYFLFVTKCDMIAERIGTKKGDFVIKRGTVK